MITNRALFAYAKSKLDELESRWRHLPLNHHDWDDLKQTILIRIFERRHLIDPSRPSFKPYVKTLISRAFQNHMRDNTLHKQSGAAFRARHALRFAAPFVTRIRQDNEHGEEESVYESDMMAPTPNISDEARARVSDLINDFSSKDQRLLRTIEDEGDWGRASKRLNQPYYITYCRAQRLAKRIRAHLVAEGFFT